MMSRASLRFRSVLLFSVLILASGCAMNLPYEKAAVIGLAQNKAAPLEITFLGNSTLYIKSINDKDSSAILVDGFVSRPGLLAMLTGLDYQHLRIDKTLNRAGVQLDHNDYIIPVHSHYDHLLDAPYIAYHYGATLFSSPSTSFIASGIEKRLKQNTKQQGKVERSIEQEKFYLEDVIGVDKTLYELPAFNISLEKAIHCDAGRIAKFFAPLCQSCELSGSFAEKRPSKAFKEGITVNINLQHKDTGKRLYVMGGLPADYRTGKPNAVSNLMQADIVFLTVPVLKYSLEDQQQWDQFFEALAAKPKTIVPVHWDLFMKALDKDKCQGKDLSQCLLVTPMLKKTIERLNKTVCFHKSLNIIWLTGFSKLSVGTNTNLTANVLEESCE